MDYIVFLADNGTNIRHIGRTHNHRYFKDALAQARREYPGKKIFLVRSDNFIQVRT